MENNQNYGEGKNNIHLIVIDLSVMRATCTLDKVSLFLIYVLKVVSDFENKIFNL